MLVGMAGLEGEDEVDGVLGQDRDEGEDGDRQPGRYVELRDLGRPREQEGGADDRQAVEQRLDRMREPRRRQADVHTGQHHAQGEGERQHLASRVHVEQVVVGRHGSSNSSDSTSIWAGSSISGTSAPRRHQGS